MLSVSEELQILKDKGAYITLPTDQAKADIVNKFKIGKDFMNAENVVKHYCFWNGILIIAKGENVI